MLIQWTPLAPSNSPSSDGSQKCLKDLGCRSVAEHLPSVFKALSLILSTATTKDPVCLMTQWVPHLVHRTDKVDLILGLQVMEVVCVMPFSPPYTHNTTTLVGEMLNVVYGYGLLGQQRICLKTDEKEYISHHSG